MERENIILLICILFVGICYIVSANNFKKQQNTNETIIQIPITETNTSIPDSLKN